MIPSLILYFQFFTRLSLNVAIDQPLKRMKSGVKYFSLFGALIGIIEAAVFFLVRLFFEPVLAFLIVLFFDAVLTGAFHLDALSDMADGLFSSRNKERMLEIMKDSRVGSNGVLSLVFYYLFSLLAFQTITHEMTELKLLLVVICFQMIGKNSITLLFYKMVYAGASPNGLGAAFLDVRTKDILWAQFFTLSLLLISFQWIGVMLHLGCNGFTWAYRRLVIKKVAGLNGDTLGAASPLSQVVYLLLLVLIRGFL